MKTIIARDKTFGYSIWTNETPHYVNDMWQGKDNPYNTNCVYVSEDLIALLDISLEVGELKTFDLCSTEKNYEKIESSKLEEYQEIKKLFDTMNDMNRRMCKETHKLNLLIHNYNNLPLYKKIFTFYI